MFHIYIISLKEDTARRDHVMKLQKKIEGFGAECTIVDAFYWKSHNIPGLLQERGFTLGNGLSLSQMACFLSHYTAWELIAKSESSKHSIIIEDDVDITEEFNLVELEQSIDSLPAFDAILLWKHPEQEHVTTPYNEMFSKYSYTWGNVAYIYTPSFIRHRLLNKTINNPVDEQMNRMYDPERTFIAKRKYFKNIGFLAGSRDYGPYIFKSNIYG